MLRLLNFYFHRRVFGFALFQIAFFAMMWLSKAVHLLYFEEQGFVAHFGVAYSAMAIAGYLAIFAGHATDHWGLKKTLAAGCVFYAVGLGLRLFPSNVAIVVASGVTAGLGASTVLSALRVWMVELSSEENTAQMVGVRTSTSALGTAFGCLMVAAIPLTEKLTLQLSYRDLLAASALGVLALSIAARLLAPKTKNSLATNVPRSPLSGLKMLAGEHRALAALTSVLGITTGLYISFISPYLPLIMKQKGLGLLAIGLSTGLFSLVRFAIDPIIARQIEMHKSQSLSLYLAAEVLIALVTAAFLLPLSPTALIGFLLLRSGALAVSVISEEVLWLKLFPKSNIGLFFGLNQSAFLLGDCLGGILSSSLYQSHGLDVCVSIVLGVMLVNVLLFSACVHGYRVRSGATVRPTLEAAV